MNCIYQLLLTLLLIMPFIHSAEKEAKIEALGYQQYAKMISQQIKQLEVDTQKALDAYGKEFTIELPGNIYGELLHRVDVIHNAIVQYKGDNDHDGQWEPLSNELLQKLFAVKILSAEGITQ